MDLPLDLLHRTPEEAARRIALALLNEAHAACERLDDADDEEALHDFRVAIRRLRSTLRAWKHGLRGTLGKRHRAALRSLQQATGGGRDAEVALAWLEAQRRDLRPAHRRGHQWLVRRLEERLGSSMAHAREQVREAFRAMEGDLRGRVQRMKLEVRLDEDTCADAFGAALARKAREHVQDLVVHLGGIGGVEDEETAHEARIRCKRLRYLTEPVQDHAPAARDVVKLCKRLQDVLGELNDARVLRDETGRAVEEAAAEHARRLYELMRSDAPDDLRRELRRSERSGLLEITRRLRARQRKLFGRLTRDWLGDGAARLVKAVETLARQAEAHVAPGEEIERKYLLHGAPALPEQAEALEIEQGYLPGRKLVERVRVTRRNGTARYTRTVKLGSGVRRTEVEEPIDEALFEALWPLTEGRRVRKRRHVVKEGEAVWEVDEFLDRDLWLAEIELSDPATPIEMPAWLADVLVEEVTELGSYTNRALSR